MRVRRADGAQEYWLLVASALAVTLVGYYALSTGSWLDEYWQLYISGASPGDLPGRLIADAHPPWFNLIARPMIAISGGEVVAARLVSLAGALVLLATGLLAMRGFERGIRWRIFLLAVASAGPAGMTELGASFRVYPWLLALAVLQSALLLLVAQKRAVPLVLALAVTAASIAFHYVHAAGAIAIALVAAYLAWRNGDRRAFAAIAAGAAIGCGLDLVTGLTQLPYWRTNFDVNWIALSGGGGLKGVAQAPARFVLFNLVSATLLAIGLARMRGRAPWLWLFAPLPIAFATWLAMDMVTTLLVARYLAAATALLAVAAAASWQSLALGRVTQIAFAFLVALQPMAYSFLRPPLPGWEVRAAMAAQIVRACPSSELFAVSAWRFRNQAESRAAAFEEPVYRFGFERVGAAFDLRPRFVDRPMVLPSGPCPSIVWSEEPNDLDQASPATVLRRARLTAPAGATMRYTPTPTGALLIVSSPTIPNPQSLALQGTHGRP